ncbi:hypothetical protein Pelo_10859 [Pelomyxa schiedti]|nr:hypothetical protein Pelo_10859 [Pelomyxa schiedti]
MRPRNDIAAAFTFVEPHGPPVGGQSSQSSVGEVHLCIVISTVPPPASTIKYIAPGVRSIWKAFFTAREAASASSTIITSESLALKHTSRINSRAAWSHMAGTVTTH